MIGLYASAAPRAATPTAAAERPIDLVHLARMTLGDRSLEREVLQLFDRQAMLLCGRMAATASPAACADLAHTLKGSARGLGAWRVAAAAEVLESCCRADAPPEAALAAVTASVDEARDVIADLLKTH
jgi:HPt (histidine-containing phosphotransfer) domain-containing protein